MSRKLDTSHDTIILILIMLILLSLTLVLSLFLRNQFALIVSGWQRSVISPSLSAVVVVVISAGQRCPLISY